MTKSEFVGVLGNVVRFANSDIKSCEYQEMVSYKNDPANPRSRKYKKVVNREEVLVTYKNGTEDLIDITGNSFAAILYDVSSKLLNK